ncbi:MAG: PAS domain S-box protein [Gemmataceae bacterium]
MSVPARTADDSLAALRAERDNLLAILDAGTACIYLKDPLGRYAFVNRRFEDLFHLTREQVLGKTDFEIFPPEHAAAFRANDLRVMDAGRSLEMEEIAPHDDGPHIYLSLKFPMRDAAGKVSGVCGISTDITRLKNTEEDRNLFFHLTLDLLCTADFEGRFLTLSPSWRRTLGWSEEELTSRPYIDFVHPDDRDATLREAARLQEDDYQTLSFENRYRCADGSYKWLLWTARSAANRKLVYAAARDITPRKVDEQRRAEQAAELERAAASERAAHDQLKKATSHLVQTEKLVGLGQMVAGIAHEINNPLSYVINNLAVLKRDVTALRDLVTRYQDAERLAANDCPHAFDAVHACAEEIDAPTPWPVSKAFSRARRRGSNASRRSSSTSGRSPAATSVATCTSTSTRASRPCSTSSASVPPANASSSSPTSAPSPTSRGIPPAFTRSS